jgi:hypothetical protein
MTTEPQPNRNQTPNRTRPTQPTAPQVRKKRLHVNPESLVPKLPKPQELQPFPTTLAVRYSGHVGKVGAGGLGVGLSS